MMRVISSVVLAALLLGAATGAFAEGAIRVGADGAASVDALPAGPSVEVRLEEIRRRIQAALVYPRSARRLGYEGVAWVRFEIDREGAAQGVELSRSSGHAQLDRAARRSVQRAGKLPWIYGRIEIPVRFSLERHGGLRRGSDEGPG